MAQHTIAQGYIVEEYTELDFEHVTLSSALDALYQAHCDSCGTEHQLTQSGIWQCDICDSINHQDISI